MRKVYRYEYTKDSYVSGPYNNNVLGDINEEFEIFRSKLIQKHGNNENYPGIRVDCNEFMAGRDLCACKSIEQLKDWFDGFNEELFKFGFNLVEYTVKMLYETKSGRQCAFAIEDVIEKKILI